MATVNDSVVIHAGGGRLSGEWHRQDSDECLVVLRGELRVEFDDGVVRVGPGEGVLVRAHERHRTEALDGALLLSVEAVGMRRIAP